MKVKVRDSKLVCPKTMDIAYIDTYCRRPCSCMVSGPRAVEGSDGNNGEVQCNFVEKFTKVEPVSQKDIETYNLTPEGVANIERRRFEQAVEDKERKVEDIRKQKILASELESLINVMGCKTDILVNEIQRYHRTLQQELFRSVIVPLIREWADKKEFQYDARNEGTVLACKAIMERCAEELDYLPMI